MATGVPVIATREGGIPDFLFDSKNHPEQPQTGWSVNTDDPDDVARIVNAILASPDTVRTVTQNAQTLVTEKYDWNTVARSIQELLENLTKVSAMGGENRVQ